MTIISEAEHLAQEVHTALDRAKFPPDSTLPMLVRLVNFIEHMNLQAGIIESQQQEIDQLEREIDRIKLLFLQKSTSINDIFRSPKEEVKSGCVFNNIKEMTDRLIAVNQDIKQVQPYTDLRLVQNHPEKDEIPETN